MNERAALIPSIAGSITGILGRARSSALEGDSANQNARQIEQQLFRLAQIHLFDTRASAKLSPLEECQIRGIAESSTTVSQVQTRKDSTDETFDAEMLDDEDVFFDIDDDYEDDEEGYFTSQRSQLCEMAFEELETGSEFETDLPDLNTWKGDMLNEDMFTKIGSIEVDLLSSDW